MGIALMIAVSGCSNEDLQVRPIEQGLCQNDPNDPCCPGSPVILDLEGNGFELTDLAGGVRFNLNPNGNAERISWTAAGSDDAWLALDRNGNGVIDDGTELFGNFTPQPPSSGRQGYLALAWMDRNHDDVIDTQDAIYNDLRLWQDRNHDGVSDPDELSLLETHGVLGLDIRFTGLRKTDEHGNLFRYAANVFLAPGSRVAPTTYDVFLITEPLDRKAREQGAVQSNGAVSMATVEPDPFCGGGGGGGGAPNCHYVTSPATLCQGGAALCVFCSQSNTGCERVCEGFLPFGSFRCVVCDDGTCSPGRSQDPDHNCTSFVS
jgi:hypothetical protein